MKKRLVDEEYLKKKKKLMELAKKHPDKFFEWLTGFKPRPFQKKFMKTDKPRVIMVTSRQVGKSFVTAVKAIWRAWLFPKQYILVLSPTIRQSSELFRKIKELVKEKNVIYNDVVRMTQTEIEFVNGSIIKVIPANETSVRGFTVNMAIVDEAAYVRDDVFAALEPVLSVAFKAGNGQLIMISTPGAPRGYFYDVWMNGDKKHWEKIRATFDEANYDEDFIENFRKTHSEIKFKREILGLFVDDDSSTLFTADVVKNNMNLPKNGYSVPQEGFAYFLGVDVARTGDDYTSIAVIGVPVEYLDNPPLPDEFEVYVHKLYKKKGWTINKTIGLLKNDIIPKWNPIKIGIDSLGIGGGFIDVLREYVGNERVVEIKAMGNDRIEMYMTVKRMLEEKRLHLPNDMELLEHFSNYEVKYSTIGKVQIKKRASGHDDLSDAITYGVWTAFNNLVRSDVKVDVLDVNIDELFGGVL